jgi:glycosyltransferase involved in cell wall biosynthesis
VRGAVPKAELAELYRRAAAVLLLSRFEGFGIPVLEAMASGTPVVLSDDPALREVAGDAGVYGSVDEALSHRARYRAAGLERAAQFSWRRTAELTVGAYRKVLAR